MERREAPAGLRDPLWRSLAIGPAGRLVRPPPPLVWGRRLGLGLLSRKQTNLESSASGQQRTLRLQFSIPKLLGDLAGAFNKALRQRA